MLNSPPRTPLEINEFYSIFLVFSSKWCVSFMRVLTIFFWKNIINPQLINN